MSKVVLSEGEAQRFYARPELKQEESTNGVEPRREGQSSPQRVHRTGEFIAGTNLMEAHINAIANNKQLQALIRSAMDGSMPLDRPLKYWEPATLNGKSMQVVLLKLIGHQGTEIEDLVGYTQTRISIILNHPYALRILSAGFTASLADVSSVRKRMQRSAPKILDEVEEIILSKKEKSATRVRAAFGWLDRAGYSTVQKSESHTKVSGELKISENRAKLLTEAIREAKEPIQEADYDIVGDSQEQGTALREGNSGLEEASEAPDTASEVEAYPSEIVSQEAAQQGVD